MNTIVKKIIKDIEKLYNKESFYEVLSIDNDLIVFANKGNIYDIKDILNHKLSPYNYMINIINMATAHIVSSDMVIIPKGVSK
jgi:hypothetical protein